MRKESRAMDSMWALEVMHKAHPEVCLSAVTRCAPDMQAIAKLDTVHSLFLDHHSGEIAMQDKGYAEFQSKLTPGVPTESFIGVRVPVLRKFAKEFAKEAEVNARNARSMSYTHKNTA